jgi:purine-nucleoside phosphorylase
MFKNQNVDFREGVTWTTDAPFRELRSDVLKYQKDGVLAVDMEAAGVFAVAQANHCQAAAVFSVADMLADGVWRMPSDLREAHSSLHVAFDNMCSALSES